MYKWFDRFDEEGPEGLYDRERTGRPPKVDEEAEEAEEAEEELKRVLEAPPTEEGYEATRWTTPKLAEHLEKKLGTDVHPETVREALQRLEFSWKRPRRDLPDDPDYAEHIAEIDQAIANVGPETTVLFEDETELRRFPPLRRAWMPRGEQREVAVPESNDKFALYGALDVLEGKTITKPYPKGRPIRSYEVVPIIRSRFFERCSAVLRARFKVLIWDRARWHTSKAVEGLIDGHDRLNVLLLPKRSPEDNPVEDLWRELKSVIAANLERSLEALKAACQRFFDNLSPEQVLHTAGLYHD